MAESVLVCGGRVVGETDVVAADVLVEGERIVAVGQELAPPRAARRLDARGCLVFPGFIDLHVHVGERIAGLELADDFTSATTLALQNGITCLGVFAHQGSGTLRDAVDTLRETAEAQSCCDFTIHLGPTRFDERAHRDIEVLVERGARTLKLYTTYRQAGLYADPTALRGMLELAAKLGLRVLVHCEDDAIVAAHPRRPVSAEVRAIEDVARLARSSGAKVHIVHVSSQQGLQAAQAGRRRGYLSVETCPQYLCFDETQLERPNGHRFLCSPPLRSTAEQHGLLRGILSGEVDTLATDHCPFTAADKDRFSDNRDLVPRGLPGIGALVPVAFDLLAPSLGPVGLAKLLSCGPARIAGLFPRKGVLAPGSDADLCVLRLGGAVHSVRSTLGDAHDPYAHRMTDVEVRHVLTRGHRAVEDGIWRGDPGHGRLGWSA